MKNRRFSPFQAPPALLRWSLGALLTLVALVTPVWGQNQQTLPAETKFLVRLSLNALQKSEFGAKLMAMAKEELFEQIKESAGENADADALMDVLGFDPFKELQTITISASEFENPEESMIAVLQMQKTTGNLEGLLLGLPGYSESNYKSHKIYSAKPDENVTVHGTIQTGSDGNKRLVISSSRNTLESFLDDAADLGSSSGSRSPSDSAKTPKVVLDAASIISVRVLDLPEELLDMMDGGPQAAITKMLQSLALDLYGEKDILRAELSMETEKEEQAEQVRQMVQGLLALVQFAQSADSDNEDFEQFKKYAKELKADRNGNSVKIQAKVPTDGLMEMLQEQLHKRTKH